MLRIPLSEPLFLLGALFVAVVFFVPGDSPVFRAAFARSPLVGGRPARTRLPREPGDRLGAEGRGGAAAPDPRARLRPVGLGARPAGPRGAFEVISFDNRGIGDSDVPPGPYTVADMATDAVRVLDEAGVERAHVVGTSLGGMVAQELALAFPERVDRLVLACTTPGGPRSHPMPAVTVALMAEAAALEPAVALRRFVENALAPATVAQAARARRPDHGPPARERPERRSVGRAGDRRRDVRRVRPARRPPLRRRSSSTAARTSSSIRKTPSCSSSCFHMPASSRFPALGTCSSGRSPSASSRRSGLPGREIMSDRTLTIGRWLADRARATPARRDPVPRRGVDLRRSSTGGGTELAAGLGSEGLARGDRLATLTSTSPDHVATMFACASPRGRPAADLVAARGGRGGVPAGGRGAVPSRLRPSTRS